MVPLMKCIIIPSAQLPPSILPKLAAMSIFTPIMGETKYIIKVITRVPANPPSTVFPIQEYPTVGIGFPEKSRSTEVSGSMDLYAVSPQDGGAHLTGSLAAVDQENCCDRDSDDDLKIARAQRPRRSRQPNLSNAGCLV